MNVIDVRFWNLADMGCCTANVRFEGKADMTFYSVSVRF